MKLTRMKRISVAIVFTAGASASSFAHAQDIRTRCAKGDDQRLIEVLRPGNVGASCDVQYTYSQSGAVKVPYHANNSAGFCVEKASDIIADLASRGYACAAMAEVAAADTASTPPLRTAVETAETAAPVSAEQPRAAVSETIDAPALEQDFADFESDRSTDEVQPDQKLSSAPAGAVISAAPSTISNDALAETANEVIETAVVSENAPSLPDDILAEAEIETVSAPALVDKIENPAVASGGPAVLTENAVDAVRRAPRVNVVGRIVGAPPDEVALPDAPLNTLPVDKDTRAEQPGLEAISRPAVAPTLASETAEDQAPVTSEPENADKGGLFSRVIGKSPRPVEDVVRNTLDAQLAAWNEGDIEAFMSYYWNNEDLRFVTGEKIARGWSAARKHYRDAFPDASSMGSLDLKKIGVEMISEDVAVISGKISHEINDGEREGLVSLVMKRMDGVWRIVHDHTSMAPDQDE